MRMRLQCQSLHSNLKPDNIRISQHLIASHRISSHLTASHRISSHLIASHRISLHLTASYRISPQQLHRIASQHISSHLIASQHICAGDSGAVDACGAGWHVSAVLGDCGRAGRAYPTNRLSCLVVVKCHQRSLSNKPPQLLASV